MLPRVGRCQDIAQCTRGSACISLSGASTATGPGPNSELGRAAPPASVPPGASAARSFGVGCRPPGDVGTGGQNFRCRDARIGALPPSKGGFRPRHWQACGPGLRFSRLPASARWIGQAPGPGLPAWEAPSRTSKRGCAVRSGLSQGPWQVAGEHSFVTGTQERLARKAGCTGGFEERDADD